MRVGKLALVFLLVFAVPAAAQDRKKPEIKQESIELKGLIAGVQNGVVQIVADREHEGRKWQEPWLARVTPASKVDVVGFADREFLRPGMIVRLTAEFDLKSGVALEPVTDLIIATPRLGDQVGIFADEEVTTERGKKGPPPKTAKLRIFDTVTGVKENTLIFKKYRVEVSPEAIIKVDVADPSVLSRGDKVEKVKGWYVKGRPGAMFIEDIDVSLAQPLAPRKRTPPNTARTQGGKNDLFNVAGDEATGKKAPDEDDDKADDQAKKKDDSKDGNKKPDAKKGDSKKPAAAKGAANKDAGGAKKAAKYRKRRHITSR
jgi:hypothetical protein